jgi:hypothetical protein
MTLTMADDIYAATMPTGYDAYAGYTDGKWPSYAAIAALFPAAHLYSITALGGVADECDCETGDLTSPQAVAWAKERLAAGAYRPGIYASASTMATGILPGLAAAGVDRSSVRLRSAHYGAGEHICGPATCNLVPVPMDGTQWTSTAPGINGAQIDASLLADDFFTGPAAPAVPPSSLIHEEDHHMQLTTTGEVIPLRFPVFPAYVFLFADFLDQTVTSVNVRVALHKGSGGWDVETKELTPGVPGVTLPLPGSTYDAASFRRDGDGPAVAVSWR